MAGTPRQYAGAVALGAPLTLLALSGVMLLEALFPPLPSEPFLLAAGVASERGTLSTPGAVLAAAAGSTLGATAWYAGARAVGEARIRGVVGRYGRWLGVRERDLDRALHAFNRRRFTAVLVGRFLPVGRMAVSLPAGAAAMPLPEFLVATAAGSAVWSGLVIGAGQALGSETALTLLWRYDTVFGVVLGVVVLGLIVTGLRRRG